MTQTMTVTPTGSRVLIRILKPTTMTPGGIVIAAQNQEPNQGIVVNVGPEVKHLIENDRVLFSPRMGTKVEVERETMLVLDESDILATIK